MSTILEINLSSPSTQTQDTGFSSFSLLRLIPPEYGFLLMLLSSFVDCTAFTVYPPSRPDGDVDQAGDSDADIDADGDVDSDSDVDGDADTDVDPDIRPDAEPDIEVADRDEEFDQEMEADVDEEGASGCRIGDRRESYSGPEGTEGVGICQPRIEECLDGISFIVTQTEVLPRDEVVGNGVDENCDGFDDECVVGERRETYTGPAETRSVGLCRDQVEECQRAGSRRWYGLTQTEVLPAAEISLNMLDEDCDGFVDECDAGMISRTYIERDGDAVGSSVTVRWEFAGGGAWAVDIYTIYDFSVNPASWRIAEVPERLASIIPAGNSYTFSDASSQVGSGWNVYYKVVCAGTALDLPNDTVGKFDLVLRRGMNLVSLPLIPFDTNIVSVLGWQLTGSTLGCRDDSDTIYRWDGAAYTNIAWFIDSDDPALRAYNHHWLDAVGTTDVTDTFAINADEGFWIQVQNEATSHYLTIVGQVSATDRTMLLGPRDNPIGSTYPVAVSLDRSGLLESGAALGDIPPYASRVYEYNEEGTGYYQAWLRRDGVWIDAETMEPSTMQFTPGLGYIIENPEGTTFTWTYPRPY